jgi:uncharacterized membrane protein
MEIFDVIKKNKSVIVICLLFFFAYATLSVIRHLHFGSFGFDLGISDQIVWKYSQLQAPITTVQAYPFTSIFTDHIEFIYILIAPFYWLFNNALTLLLLQSFIVTTSAIPIYLLAKKKGLSKLLGLAIVVSYLMFYGIQNALWFDVHSLSFGAAFLAWFIYFLEARHTRWAIIAFLLAIGCKEDIALLTGIISFVYLLQRRDKVSLALTLLSGVYLFTIFYIYFPYFTQDGYRYAGEKGIFGDVKPTYFYDTAEKREVMFYSLAWFGFLPLLAPLYLLPALGDLSHYFVFANSLNAAQGFFMHYRVTLAPLLVLPLIIAISRFKRLQNNIVAGGILLLALFFQYYLHLPLSYLTKQWFWHEPASVANIKSILTQIPSDASVVSQNNITPHVSHRDLLFTLYPTTKDFSDNSPCEDKTCRWFRWEGNPQYMVVDTSGDWDIRHLLANREEYISGLQNLEKAKVIEKYKQKGDTVLYKVLKRP